MASLPEITQELNLELARVRQMETFTRTDERTLLWGWLDLGSNVAQISVPVTYRYQVSLKERWELTVKGERIEVQAPRLQVALPPAIHTDELMSLSVRGWARGSPKGLLKQLEQELTPMLTRNALDHRRLALIEGTCERSVTEFIQLWLEREGEGGRFREIKVSFAESKQINQ